MKAARIQDYGDANVIKVVDIDTPTPNNGQVLVKIRAASLNPFDTMVRAGFVKDMIPLQLPITLGGDIAGVVTEVGADISTFKVGDAVYGQASAVAGNSGAFAEFAITMPSQIARMPRNLTPVEAGAMPLVGVSALQALTEHLNLTSGQKIFIHGGSGGIGSIAIQIAKHLGAFVATTATGPGIDLVKSLGADIVIDYKTEEFANSLSDFDAVFDTVGGDDFVTAYKILKRGAVAVSMISPGNAELAESAGITSVHQMTRVTTDKLNALRELIESGIVTPRVGKVFPLSDVQAAFTARESGNVQGKIVLEIAQD